MANSRAQKGVTLDVIAQQAGTSVATVSKALNGRTDISGATRRKVLKVAAELGYTHRRMVETSTHVALVADAFETLYTTEILRGAAQECMRQDLLLTAAHVTTDETIAHGPLTEGWLATVAPTHLGLILVTSTVEDTFVRTCARLNLPFLAVDPRSHPQNDVFSIGATNWNGALDATRHLTGLGHRKIAFVGGKEDSFPSIERFQGYLSALQMSGLKTRPEWRDGGDYTFEAGVKAGTKFFSLPPHLRPTAVFAASDWIALGVLDAARSHGLSVPEDVSVIGFDDTHIAATSSPRLTTVRQPMAEMGAVAVRTLVDMHQGLTPIGPLKLNTELVKRASTAPPPVIEEK